MSDLKFFAIIRENKRNFFCMSCAKISATKSTQDDKCYKMFRNTSSVALNGEKRESASSSLTHIHIENVTLAKHQPQSYEFEYCFPKVLNCGM